MITRRRCLALLPVSLILGKAFGAAGQTPVPEVGIGEYRLGPGDKVRVHVFNEPDLSGDFDIDGTGQLALPLIGTIQAGGLRLMELEALITKALAGGYLKNPRVTAVILTYRPFYIYGEVRLPGGYAYVNGMRMVNAVVLAGGYTPRAPGPLARDPTGQRSEDRTRGNRRYARAAGRYHPCSRTFFLTGAG